MSGGSDKAEGTVDKAAGKVKEAAISQRLRIFDR